MRQIIGAETKKVRVFCYFIGCNCRTRYFYHGTHQIIDLHLACLHNLFGNTMNRAQLICELFLESHERNHDLRIDFDFSFAPQNLCGRFKYCASLHFSYLRMKDAESATAAPQHWVLLMQCFNSIYHEIERHTELFGELTAHHVIMGQELVQWWIEEPNRDWPSIHRFE